MKLLLKIFYVFAVSYLILQLGRWWGYTEVKTKIITPVTFDSRVDLYNEVMLRNCLLKNK